MRKIGGRDDRGIRVADGEDIGDGHPLSSCRENLGELVEHRGCAVEGQRFVDGPQPPAGVSETDGRDRRRDRCRMVSEVVQDGNASDFALELEPPAHALERGKAAHDRVGWNPVRLRRRRGGERIGRVVAADQAQGCDGKRSTGTIEAGDGEGGIALLADLHGSDDGARRSLRG